MWLARPSKMKGGAALCDASLDQGEEPTMFGKGFKLFTLFGFQIKIELSWLILAALVTWSLAANVFPTSASGLSTATYWWMGAIGAALLFASVVFHELCHSLVARQYGLPIKGITLFIFGGVSEMEDEPPSAQSEFLVAVVGPVSSAVLAAAFYGLSLLGKGAGWPVPVNSVSRYLASINISLAAFNILPAFPLDGGRVLRSILWGWRKDLRWATRLAARIGQGFGVGLLALGVLYLFLGNFVGGLWMFVIGSFLQNASRTSYRQLFVRQALEGEHVQRFMQTDVVSVSPTVTVKQLVEDYIYRYHFKMFPVMEDGTLVGCVSTRAVQRIPRDAWGQHVVGELSGACSPENTVRPTDDAIDALATMSRTQNSRLMVVDDGRLVGVITLKDILEFLSLKLDLER
jgi:Zn-dependent protease/predicted transcriptional regulator